jgi:hypothetical protein
LAQNAGQGALPAAAPLSMQGFAAVPEPSAVVLAASAIAAIGVIALRTQRRAPQTVS